MFNRKVVMNDPKLSRARLTPQILDYDKFSSRSLCQYLPYLMSFNPGNFVSDAINTDSLGFRFSHTQEGKIISVGSQENIDFDDGVNLLFGSSSALGYGSTSDSASLVSRLSAHDPQKTPWLNMAGHCFNSLQELMLFILHSHKLPKIKNIVILGGFNTLVMARLPDFVRGTLPPFYFCGEFFEKFDDICEENGGEVPAQKLPKWPSETNDIPPIDITLDQGAADTLLRLETWSQLSSEIGAKLIFIQQPLATWVREPCYEEKILFDELDTISRLGTWEELYGDISTPGVADRYAEKLAAGCSRLGVTFRNLVTDLQQRPENEWLFVDRAHYTDIGNDIVAASVHTYLHG